MPEDAERVPSDEELTKWHRKGCKHYPTVVDLEERKLTCKDCGVELDPYVRLLRLGDWIGMQDHRWSEMNRRDTEVRRDRESHLYRITAHRTHGLMKGRARYDGIIGGTKVPTEALVVGDYVAHNLRYRVRKNGEGWEVAFWDHDHGLKTFATLARPTLAQTRTAVRHHWRDWHRRALHLGNTP